MTELREARTVMQGNGLRRGSGWAAAFLMALAPSSGAQRESLARALSATSCRSSRLGA